MKIISISDLHGHLPIITESADILCIAGDISPLSIQFNKPEMKKWLETEFAYWIKSLPVDKVYLVAGNHDAYFESMNSMQLSTLKHVCDFKLIYLKNDYVVHRHDGKEYKIFGTPYCNIFGTWPFMRTDEYMIEKFKNIPENVDIIISHSPPYGIGEVDVILERYNSNEPIDHVGNKALGDRLKEVNYKLCICGHIHSASHTPIEFNGGKCVNVSMLNENYHSFYKPFYYEL